MSAEDSKSGSFFNFLKKVSFNSAANNDKSMETPVAQLKLDKLQHTTDSKVDSNIIDYSNIDITEMNRKLSANCTACSTGEYYDSGTSACAECAKGYYHGTTHGLACNQCPDGTYASSKGQASCTTCPPGKFLKII